MNKSSLFPVADKRRLSFAQLHADVNGDERSDLLVQTGEDEISIYRGQNTKVFGEQPSLKLEGKISHNLIVDDINMDKNSDLIFWYDKSEREAGVLDIYLF